METQGHPEKLRVSVDAYTRVCLTLIAGLLTVLIIGLWCQAPPAIPSASAQTTPDARGLPVDQSVQRDQMVTELKGIRAQLAEINKTLTSGQVKVTMQAADDKKEEPIHAPILKTK